VFLDTTLDGVGVIRGDVSPECAAMVTAVLDALSGPQGAGDLRTHSQRYHDALEEAMRRLLASNLLPQRAGQPVKALVHISFADLCQLDVDSAPQDKWIEEYRARWAAHRAAASVSPGDGGAWLDGDAARAIVCDAMTVPVVIGDIDPAAIEDLIAACAHYHRLRAQAAAGDPRRRRRRCRRRHDHPVRAGRGRGRAHRPDGRGTGHAGAPDPVKCQLRADLRCLT